MVQLLLENASVFHKLSVKNLKAKTLTVDLWQMKNSLQEIVAQTIMILMDQNIVQMTLKYDVWW